MDDLKKALEDIRQRQNPVQERVNPLANEKIVKEDNYGRKYSKILFRSWCYIIKIR